VPFNLAAVPESVPVHPATLVIGAGIAGIQAALEIADAGKKVYLVERTGTIGGHMAMFDKTFPTLDCAACILTPKMVAVGQHPMIDLMVFSEVREVAGRPGNYRVRVLRRATRVDAGACVACRLCADVCPVTVPSEFDAGIATRKAIYIPFPQAVPNSYLIDPASCVWVTSGGVKCGACVKKCAKDAIHMDAHDETVDLDVGNIIVATGYDTFDARRIERYGYGVFPNVLTALEFERLTNASGPTGGKIVMKAKRLNRRTKKEEWVFDTDGPQPRNVAIIHCVGSRDMNYNRYCSRVCCMYSLKFGHLVREKLPDARVYEYYIDMRAFGKGYEEFFERVKHEGVFVVRGRSASVTSRDGQMLIKGEDILGDRVVEFPVDMVLLSVGLQPTADAGEVARLLGIDRVEDGWFNEMNYNVEPTSTECGGIYVAGVCQGPKDIPDTVAQASAVAAKVLRSIVSGTMDGSRRWMTLEEIEAAAHSLAAERSKLSTKEAPWPFASTQD
jgi:heterodisulfide reductase subunit A